MSDTEIVYLHGRRVWDSRGRPTVEAEIMLEGGAVGRAIAPAGASTGSGEALDLRDGGETFGGWDVARAVASVNGEIAVALVGLDGADQAAVDAALIKLDGTKAKSRLGGNAILAVSMAAAHAAAGAAGVPLYRHLGGEDAGLLPLPQIQIFGGGAHAGRRVDIQDFLVVCPAAKDFAEALDWTAEVYRAAGSLMKQAGKLHGVADEGGWWPDFSTNEEALETLVRAIDAAGFDPGAEVAIALDVAASQFGKAGVYRLGLEGRELDSDGMIAMLTGWLERYPIVSIEDPLAEDDFAGFVRFTAAVGDRVQVVGDDLLVTDAAKIREAASQHAVNCVLLKPNQCGTLTETAEAWAAAKAAGFSGIVSARSGETEDTTIVHLAVGWGVGQLKVGSMARGERTAKWNEALRIEEAMGPRGKFAGGAVLARLAATPEPVPEPTPPPAPEPAESWPDAGCVPAQACAIADLQIHAAATVDAEHAPDEAPAAPPEDEATTPVAETTGSGEPEPASKPADIAAAPTGETTDAPRLAESTVKQLTNRFATRCREVREAFVDMLVDINNGTLHIARDEPGAVATDVTELYKEFLESEVAELDTLLTEHEGSPPA